jgi:threonine/homoserine/homoserine lactone efflux protein
MPALSTLPVFAIASLVLLVIPGPAVLYIVARSGAQGTRAGLVSIAGVHAASVVHVVAAAAGLSALLVASSVAYTAVKAAGGVYLIYLGIKAIRAAHRSVHLPSVTRRGARRLFGEGFVVNLFNPKVALFFLAFLPQFIDADGAPVWAQTLVLGGVYVVLGLCSDSVYAVLGARLGSWFARRSDGMRITRYTEGGILVGLGVLTLAIPHRPAKR